MHIEVDIVGSEGYFARTDRKVDWEENDSTLVPMHQANLIDEIISLELGVEALQECTGICGSNIDTLRAIKLKTIKTYERAYEPYVR